MKKVKFSELNISKEILKAVEDMGFEETTPIQTKAIPPILNGKDIIGQAQTGTGKTAAFGIPLLEKIDTRNKKPQAIILCPTRELAIQVAEELKRLAKYKRSLYTLPVYGGQSIKRQIKALKKGVQVIIGTPGRVMDHMRRGTLNLSHINFVVLDEADVMLDMGFIDDIKTILKDIPNDRQTLFFSATIPETILDLSKRYQKKSQFIKIAHEKLTVPGIEQYYYEVRRSDKLKVLTRLIDLYSPGLSLIFCNTRKMVEELNIQLQARGYLSDALHGGFNQNQRDRVMDKFRNGIIEILVATDVAARGIDVNGVEAVFNYDVPQDTDYYVHRIGRTGRAGKTGKAFTFVVGKDIYKLRDIQKYTKTRIIKQDIPTLTDIEQAKLENLINDLTDYIDREHLKKYIKIIENLLDDDYTAIEIAAALFKKYMENESSEGEINNNKLNDTGAEPGMVRLFINIGKKHNITPGHIVGAIAGETSLSGRLIGAIDLYDNFTFVEVPEESSREVLKIMKNNYIKGKKINIEPAKPR
ncbi:DEAD/DEAH box helicase [Halothermothrix orenii]|uniref:ATP-dependent RNA helicase CshA n=1 Tax=Halothermothrix orenii (strain H 168 / OCM 544 / DSM 9562) TaxID=373903 RepID=B8D278_HALOH|nr:DEAD/DEAH box helicase [Halothermothrix orenii]ACL69305.1 DEAD/DEAH box helicase domain protein [Halothermothrix orenii H 168]